MKVALLRVADRVSHFLGDPYMNAKPFGHHLPGWGRLQLWQWHLCNYYCDAEDAAHKETR